MKAIIIAGATASGKSSLAIEIAKAVNGVIINSDSMQIYKDLSVLTARPSIEDEKKVSHKLYGVLEATKICSAGYWVEIAKETILETLEQGKIPILCGGTGLYLRAFSEGLSYFPKIENNTKLKVQNIVKNESKLDVFDELTKIDEETVKRININDSQRIMRAFELFYQTGKNYSHWRSQPLIKPIEKLEFFKIFLNPAREKIYDNCNKRFEIMLKLGAIDEVKKLLKYNLGKKYPIMGALGVKEISDYLADKISLDDAISQSQMMSRRYAKRQLTWFNNQYKADLILQNNKYEESTTNLIDNFLAI